MQVSGFLWGRLLPDCLVVKRKGGFMYLHFWAREKALNPRAKRRSFAQETMKTFLTSGYVEAVPAPGWHFFHGKVWVFLYLGQDFCAKTHLMNKPPSLPSKPVSFHSHFFQTGKHYFSDSLFVICLFCLCLLLFPPFQRGVM